MIRPSRSRVERARWRFGVVLTALLLAVSGFAAASSSSHAAAPALPDACTLLTQVEASTLAATPLNPPDDVGGGFCQFTGPTDGPEAQVEITISTGPPRTLDLDRQLGHQITAVPNLGDEAYAEDWYIFVRSGAVWVSIHLVRSDDPALYVQPLQQAAAAAIARIPAGAAPVQNPPPLIVGHVPAGGGSNPRWPGNQGRFGGNLGQQGIVYQPAVVRIPGGASAIRAVSSDGLTWTLAGNAVGVANLQVGKIMAATTLAVGRVIALKHVGPNVVVTLGPVTPTDLFREARFDATGAPLAHPLYYSAATPATPAQATRARRAASAPAGGTLTATPICCTYTGVRLTYDNPEGRLAGSVELFIPKPSINFDIVIHNGSLQQASFRINSTSTLDYDVLAATKSASGNFKTGDQVVPVSISLPLGGGLALTFTQSFQASMQLAGAATFHSRAEYSLTGSLGFSYKKGGGSSADAAAFATKTGVLNNTSSTGLGPNTMKLAWAIRATVGVGVAGFTAGGWYELQPTLAVAMDATPGSKYQGCVTAGFSVGSDFGVGWTIPTFALKAVNAVFGALGAKPVAAFGGLRLGPKTLFNPAQGTACPPGVTPPTS